jgi:hypothetical protein
MGADQGPIVIATYEFSIVSHQSSEEKISWRRESYVYRECLP